MRIKAKKTVIDGIKFDSMGEANRYCELKALEKAGEIRNLECHPSFPLSIEGRPIKIKSKGYPNGRKCKYTADFQYQDMKTGKLVVEDYKGFATQFARFRIAVFEAIYNIEVRIT